MIDLNLVSKEILANKLKNRFPTNDLGHEILLLKKEVEEVEESVDDLDNLKKELADVVIFCISIARIIGEDLEKEILNKVEYNKTRQYKPETYRIGASE